MGIDKKLILDKADIAVVIGTRMKLKKEGNNYVGCCPFHNEKSPSFTVSAKRGIYKCFGCGRSGDVIRFVELFDRLEFQEAIDKLASELNIVDVSIQEKQKVYDLPEERRGDLSPELTEYLMNTRRLSPGTIAHLKITGSVEYLSKLKKKVPVICFNYFKNKSLRNIKFRSIDKEMQMVSGCELMPYNVDALKGVNECCITEGEIDCATLVECELPGATSCPNGATGLGWCGNYYDKKTRIVLFTDDDDPGRKLQAKLIKRLGYHRCFVVGYPAHCKDINDVLKMHGPTGVIEVYKNAVPATPPALLEDKAVVSLVEDPDEYMTVQSIGANGMTSFRPNVPGILKWARDFGYAWIKYAPEEDSPVMMIRHRDNVIHPVSDQDVLHEYLKEVDINYANNNAERRILYQFSKSFQQIFILLPYFDKPILADKRDTAYLCFLNGVVAVTAEDTSFIDYKDLHASVFSKYIIQHEYKLHTDIGDFSDFLTAVSVDPDHYESILSTIGYLLHSYKLRTSAKAVVIVEDVEDESEARGRSGKGLIAQFIELFKNTVQQDGRNYKSDDKFKLQRVDISTQVFYLNDPAPGLLLNQFYNMITDDFIVEMKGQKAYTIPFKRSPKLLVTTNHLPALTSDSDRDRFAVMAIKKTFGSKETIGQRFPGVYFFDEQHWPEDQFLASFALAIGCIQIWLTKGLIFYETAEMAANAAKRLISSQVPEYITEVMDHVLFTGKEVKTREEFDKSMKIIDLQGPYETLLQTSFSWYPGRVEVNTSSLYRYCTTVYKMKVHLRWFGRNLRFYLEKSGCDFEDVRRFGHTRTIVLRFKNPAATLFSLNDPS